VERDEGEGTCHDALTRLADHHDIGILLLGSFGRKQAEKQGEALAVLGSVADHSLRTCASHIGIVRSTSYPIEETAKFLMPIDLSQN
jgi:hypothetical protein